MPITKDAAGAERLRPPGAAAPFTDDLTGEYTPRQRALFRSLVDAVAEAALRRELPTTTVENTAPLRAELIRSGLTPRQVEQLHQRASVLALRVAVGELSRGGGQTDQARPPVRPDPVEASVSPKRRARPTVTGRASGADRAAEASRVRAQDATDGYVRSTPKRTPDDATTPLHSVGNALDVLECFATDDTLGTCDIAERLGVAKSTASRLLHTLNSRGFVDRDDATGQYRLGLHVFDLGHLAQARNQFRRIALPTLHHVAQLTGATVTIAQSDGADVVFLERMESAEGAGLLRHWGRRFPAHCTSSGKAIAAHDRGLYLARIRSGFPPRAANTIRTREGWDRAVEVVRRDGYVISHSEVVDGMSSLAAPVLHRGRAVGAISTLGATATVEHDLNHLVAVVTRAVAQIGRDLDARLS